jgi:BirA family biotin operon repressor/biotin-[acetyl-CoA-carboxylase] ligase
MYMDGGRIDSVIVGTGINVNQKEIPEELTESATALCLQKGMDFNREEILNDILIVFEEYYEEFLQKNTLQQFSNQYNEWLVSLNTEVRVLDPQGEYSGIAKGINESGELLVEVSDGKIEAVYAGEVSVRGLYGYV